MALNDLEAEARKLASDLEIEARDLASEDYDFLWANPPNTHRFDFRKEYPSRQVYVNEWWEERYLPQVIKSHGIIQK